jgi:tRNA 2-thiocytidine biosynthesis protein TtcA
MPPSPTRLAYWLLKDVNRAIRDFDMIRDGDRVAVAVSGGKDSLSLLRLLDWRRRSVPERYGVAAIHVIGDARGPGTPAHGPLLAWLAASGYDYRVEPLLLPEDEALPLNCQRCTWNRRRTLFQAAERLGCNVVALGHHADDLAQTTLLNLLVGGRVETMAPRREYFDGRLRLVRPLCYVTETELRRFARACDFPPPPEPCPRSNYSRRRLAADLMRQARQGLGRDVRTNLLRAGLRGHDMNGDRQGRSKESEP